jgi:hypothetical protein
MMQARACPHCGSDKVVTNITVRWNQARGAFQPERGTFCTSCGKAFRGSDQAASGFHAVRVGGITPALSKLQESGDLVVVRHRNGMTEVIY